MPWLKTLLLDRVPSPRDLKPYALAISGHVLYYDRETQQYFIQAPGATELNPWTRHDQTGPRHAPIGHWVRV